MKFWSKIKKMASTSLKRQPDFLIPADINIDDGCLRTEEGRPIFLPSDSVEELQNGDDVCILDVPIFYDLQAPNGRQLNKENEKILKEALAVYLVLTIEELVAYGKKREDAEKDLEQIGWALSFSTLKRNGRKLIPDWTNFKTTREAKKQYRNRYLESYHSAQNLDEINANIETAEGILFALNIACLRVGELNAGKRLLAKKRRRGTEKYDPIKVRDIYLSRKYVTEEIERCWIAIYGNVNPAELWPNYYSLVHIYEAMKQLGKLLRKERTELSPEDCEIIMICLNTDSSSIQARKMGLETLNHVHVLVNALIGQERFLHYANEAQRTQNSVQIEKI